MKSRVNCLLAVFSLSLIVTWSAAEASLLQPASASPGQHEKLGVVDGRCPTFSWGRVEGAQRYELVAYEMPDDVTVPATEPMLRVTVDGSVTSWTPDAGSCFAPGTTYAWSVRAEEGEERSNWSRARLFQIPQLPTESEIRNLLSLVERFSSSSPVGKASAVPSDRSGELILRAHREAREPIGGKPASLLAGGRTAIKGEISDTSGVTYGVQGVSNSPAGAGLAADNTAGGPDLLLGGPTTDLALRETGMEVSTGGTHTFSLENSGAGALALEVDGPISAVSFAGDGSALTNLPASNDIHCNGCVGSNDVSPTEVQRRVASSCPPGHAILGIGPNGSVTCDSELDAYADLGADGHLNNNAGTDLLIRDQLDGRYVTRGGGTMVGDLTLLGTADVVADQFRYNSGRSGFFHISALSLIGDSIVRHTGFGEAYLVTGVNRTWVEAPVHLPNGATVTDLSCRLMDNDPSGRITASLNRHNTRVEQTLATVGTTDSFASTSPQVLADGTIVFAGVDNASYAYYLVVFLQGIQNTSDLSINRCRIRYTVTEARP